jgi:thioredoxin-related protein
MASITAGTSLKRQIQGVDWDKNGQTLVFALSTQCHFCKESAPFYRRLRQDLGGSIKMIAVLPQSVAEAQQYLEAEGVRFDQVRQLAPAGVGVRGTPTILLVDSRGIVSRVWTGRLQEEEEEQVLSVLRTLRSRKG